MPAKKTKSPSAINIRLKPEEYKAIISDAYALKIASGIPFTLSAYAKHAILSHARLRKLEALVRAEAAGQDGEEAQSWARGLMEQCS